MEDKSRAGLPTITLKISFKNCKKDHHVNTQGSQSGHHNNYGIEERNAV